MKGQIFLERKRKNEVVFIYFVNLIPIRVHLHDFEAYGPV